MHHLVERVGDGRVRVMCRITGSYKGEHWEYVDTEYASLYVWPEGTEDRLGRFWWTEGNGSCDCNRGQFIGKELPCGYEVMIDRIVPLDSYYPALELNETQEGKLYG